MELVQSRSSYERIITARRLNATAKPGTPLASLFISVADVALMREVQSSERMRRENGHDVPHSFVRIENCNLL